MSDLSNILLVDDEPMVLSSLARLLEEDYNVLTAPDGFKAMDIVRSTPNIKVIISDQRMPGMLGHQLLGQVRAVSPNTVRILLTGYSDLEAVISSVNAGEIFRYINKPWRSENLLNLIKLAIQIYDRIAELQFQEAMKHPVFATSAPAHSTHIEVEEKACSVLFVDYNEKDLKHLVDKFSKTFDVSAATSIDHAFKELAKKPISVIVSDVQFSDGDGISFLNAVRQEYPQIVTVILTEVKDAMLAVRSINELQVYKYLNKPMPDDQLEKTIVDAAAKNKMYQAQPLRNVQYAAEKIAPESVPPPRMDESELRLKLRAAQALLTKINTRHNL